MEMWLNLFNAAVLAGTPLLLGTLGNILTAKAGTLNLGVEGMMFMGAATGLAGAFAYQQWMLGAGLAVSGPIAALCGLIAAFLAGMLGAGIYAVLTITLRADQNVTGLTLAIFGTGFGNFLGEYLGVQAGGYVAVSATVKAAFSGISIPILSGIPILGKLFFSYNWIVYLSIVIALVMAFFFKRTRAGLSLRAVGENPAAADAAGIRVGLSKYLATLIGGGICGIGGYYMVMVTCSGVWVHNCVAGYGWLAVALVIFASWNPIQALPTALVFGGLSVLRMYVPLGIPMQLYDMLPYVATILVLVVVSGKRNLERSQPAACGVGYFREDR